MGWAGAIQAIPGLLSLGQQFLQSNKQSSAQADAMQAQMENLAFQRAQANRQYELATAGRTNARGDSVRYVPGQGWVTTNSPDTASRISADNALNQRETVRQFTQGEPTRDRNLRRQGFESSAAEPLLTQFANGFGMPTKEGVVGKNKVAAATAATEAGDQIRSATTGAALRQGGNTKTLGSNIDDIDRNATAGLRTALARADAEGDPMFQAQLKAAQGNKLDPYNALAARAGGGAPNMPAEGMSGDLSGILNNAAGVGALRGAPGGAGYSDATKGLAAQLTLGGTQQQPDYGAFATVLAKIFGPKSGDSGSTLPPYMDNFSKNVGRDVSYGGGGGF